MTDAPHRHLIGSSLAGIAFEYLDPEATLVEVVVDNSPNQIDRTRG